jgi:hypothetical protein
MKKKIIVLLVLVTLVTGGVFAEGWNNSFKFDSGPTPQKGALFLDLDYTIAYLNHSPLGFGIGLGWEGRINDFSTYYIDGNIGLYSEKWSNYNYDHKNSGVDFGIRANYRYYFFKSALDKLFINGGVGFGMYTHTHTYTLKGAGTYKPEDYFNIWSALYFPVYAGYKFIIGPGFVLEAHAGYVVGIELSKPENYSSSYWGRPIYGVSLGWAF